jgi:predicted enzyme related to lactoylglutathione lyase
MTSIFMEKKTYAKGCIVSADLTIDDAANLRDFYAAVTGWQIDNMPMKDEGGSYEDFIMKDENGSWAAGVCHRRGVNADLPPQWIVYVNVPDIEQSVVQCKALGGTVLKEARTKEGALHYAIFQDPGGALLGLTKV